MKITLTTLDSVTHIATKSDDDRVAIVVGLECPNERCESRKRNRPALICAGTGKIIDPDHRHDTYRAAARCVTCREPVGVLRAKVSTIFGLEEDERVMSMGVRVY